ncbi:malectin domain-containing carbohydrate-binding protein [Adhaeribacter pallidiroseus]|uniref:Uncharacterized protein n=1 Tax=Adhaeribacter pallidiroseus TaxID=2072847 RepID=A0A369QG37_9BACT|nr:malectin domain-containing carbohydrate-binding protein [Adhaeribacter pallidiroseus]RDC63891.1 hypothetical protein AHMF7616_02500 [Adhaeribacter pallidiroseus]
MERGSAGSQNSNLKVTGAEYNYLNQAIYQTEWTTTGTGPGPNNYFTYRVPVTNGKYLVQLYFVESSKTRPNTREFDVKLEGQIVLPNFDIYAAANGKNKTIVRSFPVTITDGSVQLDFINQIDKAKINAIAIIPYKNATLNKEPVAKIGGSRVVTANAAGEAEVTLNGTPSYDKDGYLVLHQWYVNNRYLANGMTHPVSLKVGTHQIKLLVKDNARAIHTVTTTITVKAGLLPVKPDTITTTTYEAVAKAEAMAPVNLDSAITQQEPIGKKALTIQVFPNPSSVGDKTILELTNAAQQQEINVTIYDMAGQLMHTTILKPDEFGTARTEYQLTGKLSAGTYLIRAFNQTGSAQTKLLIR